MGYAYPHYVYEDSPLFKIIGVFDRIKIKIYKHAHSFFLRRNGRYYVCETEDVSERLPKYLNIESKRIFTVSNTYNKNYFKPDNSSTTLSSKDGTYRFLVLCSPYKHKNITILNQVIPLLKSRYPLVKIRFILTIDEKSLKSMFKSDVLDYIDNRGYTEIKECPNLYKECDATFLPTLLECYSANYAESMAMERPILTSNLSFAKTVCKDAALYFDPLNPEDIVNKIILFINNPQLSKLLIERSKRILDCQISSSERAKQYLDILMKISGK
jgi:glycosyltransferase involved in cell wall biosynthesis